MKIPLEINGFTEPILVERIYSANYVYYSRLSCGLGAACDAERG